MILPIYLYGHPVLREPAKPINKDYPELKKLVADMFETMYNADGIGLAAPQVGLSIQLLVIDLSPLAEDFPEFKDLKKVMINPEFLFKSEEEISMEEGCLSFPGLHEKVSRPEKITVAYYDEDFNRHEETYEGYLARVIQHECEHLAGHVFIDNISPIRKQLNKSKLNNIIKGKASCSYRTKVIKK